MMPNIDVCGIYCDLVRLLMDKVENKLYIASQSNLENKIVLSEKLDQELKSSYQSCRSVMKLLKKAFPAQIPSSFESLMNLTECYIQAIYCLYSNQFITALRSISSYLSLTSESSTITCTQVKQSTDMKAFSDVYREDSHLKSRVNITESWSQLHIQGKILQSKIVAYINPIESVSLYEKIEKYCYINASEGQDTSDDGNRSFRGSTGLGTSALLSQYRYETMILRANVLRKNKLPLFEYESVRLYKLGIVASRQYGLPTIEMLLTNDGLKAM